MAIFSSFLLPPDPFPSSQLPSSSSPPKSNDGTGDSREKLEHIYLAGTGAATEAEAKAAAAAAGGGAEKGTNSLGKAAGAVLLATFPPTFLKNF